MKSFVCISPQNEQNTPVCQDELPYGQNYTTKPVSFLVIMKGISAMLVYSSVKHVAPRRQSELIRSNSCTSIIGRVGTYRLAIRIAQNLPVCRVSVGGLLNRVYRMTVFERTRCMYKGLKHIQIPVHDSSAKPRWRHFSWCLLRSNRIYSRKCLKAM